MAVPSASGSAWVREVNGTGEQRSGAGVTRGQRGDPAWPPAPGRAACRNLARPVRCGARPGVAQGEQLTPGANGARRVGTRPTRRESRRRAGAGRQRSAGPGLRAGRPLGAASLALPGSASCPPMSPQPPSPCVSAGEAPSHRDTDCGQRRRAGTEPAPRGRRSARQDVARCSPPRSHRSAAPCSPGELRPRASHSWIREVTALLFVAPGGERREREVAEPLPSHRAAREGRDPAARPAELSTPHLRCGVTVSLWRGVLLSAARVWQVLEKQHGVRAGSTCPHPAARHVQRYPFSGAAFPTPWCTADAVRRDPCLDTPWLCVVVPISLVWLLSVTSCSYRG